jgi:hypothetical protein
MTAYVVTSLGAGKYSLALIESQGHPALNFFVPGPDSLTLAWVPSILSLLWRIGARRMPGFQRLLLLEV